MPEEGLYVYPCDGAASSCILASSSCAGPRIVSYRPFALLFSILRCAVLPAVYQLSSSLGSCAVSRV